MTEYPELEYTGECESIDFLINLPDTIRKMEKDIQELSREVWQLKDMIREMKDARRTIWRSRT